MGLGVVCSWEAGCRFEGCALGGLWRFGLPSTQVKKEGHDVCHALNLCGRVAALRARLGNPQNLPILEAMLKTTGLPRHGAAPFDELTDLPDQLHTINDGSN